MAMQTASWSSQGLDLVTVVRSLQKAQGEVCSLDSAQSTRSTDSGSVTPTSLESPHSAGPSGYSTPVEHSPFRARSPPLTPMASAVEPAMPTVSVTMVPAATAMGASLQMGGAMPQMWPTWWHPQQPYQLAAVPAPMAMSAQVEMRVGAEAAPGSDEAAEAPWWRLVWCHERCHKQETAPKRQRLSQAATESGAALVCLKKADKFSVWISHSQRPPFVLLTDWREAKPCLQALEEQGGVCGQPLVTVVLAEEPRQHERAVAWAAGLHESAGTVFVVETVDGALQVLRERMPSAKPSSAPAAAPAPRLPLAQLPAPRAVSMLSTGASVMQYQAYAEPCAEILSPLRLGCSNAELAAMLRTAMPEHYDD